MDSTLVQAGMSMADYQMKAQSPDPSSSKKIHIAQRLPAEILVAIFEMVILPPRLTRVHLSNHRNADAHAWRSLPYVCSQWYGPAVSVLYASIEIRTYREMTSLLRTLKAYSHLRPLIKGLHLPMRVRVSCPLAVHKLFCQIIHLVEGLREISTPGTPIQHFDRCTEPPVQRYEKYPAWTGSRLSLPIALDRHHDLVYLELRGEHRYPAVRFPRQILLFRHLKHLTLADVILTERLDPTITSILPFLEVITFANRNSFLLLDDWLCAHPKLRTLRMYEATAPSTIPPRLVSSGRIHHMEMMHCVAHQWDSHTISSWFEACTSLRSLRVSDDFLLYHPSLIPTSLEELRIEIARYWIDLDNWKRYFARNPKLDHFILSAHTERTWYQEMSRSFISYAKERTPNFAFEPPNCNCSSEKRNRTSFSVQDAVANWDFAAECECM